MSNPWEEISLDDYEKHMSLDSVRQLQALDAIMKEQFAAYPGRLPQFWELQAETDLNTSAPTSSAQSTVWTSMRTIYVQHLSDILSFRAYWSACASTL